jgi:hypothetical protein
LFRDIKEMRHPEFHAHGRERMRTNVMLILALLALAAGCDAGGGEAAAGDAAGDAAGAIPDTTAVDSPRAVLVARVEGLSGPEAVRYDPEQDVHFVANFGPRGDDPRDGNGFISRVDPDGVIESLRFMTGTAERPLHMPRGMAIRGDTLWVADVDGVYGFHRRSGEPLAFVDFTTHEPGFLNDVATGPDGALYVTDTGRSRVYRMAGGRAEVALEDEGTGPPNGITWSPEREAFLLAPWGGGQVIRAWRPGGRELEDAATVPGGRFDGIEVVDGRILVASQADSSLWVVEDGVARRVTRVPGAPADIGVDTRRGRVAVPYIALDRVELYELVLSPAPPAGR